jgi:hypothetical protein
MQADSYTKVVLTIIAACLLVLVVYQFLPRETSPTATTKVLSAELAQGLDAEELSAYPKLCKCCSSSDAAIGAYVRQEFGLSPDWDSGDDGLSHFIVIFDGEGTSDSRNIRVGAVGFEVR